MRRSRPLHGILAGSASLVASASPLWWRRGGRRGANGERRAGHRGPGSSGTRLHGALPLMIERPPGVEPTAAGTRRPPDRRTAAAGGAGPGPRRCRPPGARRGGDARDPRRTPGRAGADRGGSHHRRGRHLAGRDALPGARETAQVDIETTAADGSTDTLTITLPGEVAHDRAEGRAGASEGVTSPEGDCAGMVHRGLRCSGARLGRRPPLQHGPPPATRRSGRSLRLGGGPGRR